jgi:hypothetical protein
VTVVIEFQQQFLYVSLGECGAWAIADTSAEAEPELETDHRSTKEGWRMRRRSVREIAGGDSGKWGVKMRFWSGNEI